MTNWKVHKYASITILAVTIGVLFGFGGILGIESLEDKLFNMLPWSAVLGLGLGYVIYAFNTLIRA